MANSIPSGVQSEQLGDSITKTLEANVRVCGVEDLIHGQEAETLAATWI